MGLTPFVNRTHYERGHTQSGDTHNGRIHNKETMRNRYCSENGKGIARERHSTERKYTRRGTARGHITERVRGHTWRGDTHGVGHVRGGYIHSKEITEVHRRELH